MKLDILPATLAAECDGKHVKYEKLVKACKNLMSDIMCNDMQGGSDMSKHAKTILMAVQMIWNELEEIKQNRQRRSQLEAKAKETTMDTDNFTFTYDKHKTAIEHGEKWVAKVENEWAPNDPERWLFNTLAEMLDFLKKELTEDDLYGYDVDEFFSDLEEEANEEGCAIRTLKNGSLEMFSCPMKH